MIISAPRLYYYYTIYSHYNGSAETKGHQSYYEISSKVVPATLRALLVETRTRSGRVRNIDEHLRRLAGGVFDDTYRSSTVPHVTSETITRIGNTDTCSYVPRGYI